MRRILKIVKKYNLILIEDCAHSIESYYGEKKNVELLECMGVLVFM